MTASISSLRPRNLALIFIAYTDIIKRQGPGERAGAAGRMGVALAEAIG